ncbi:unnamed protein product [Brassicogethes aeneus]|uniref:Uncharacterized protein n=1 Tax=Brassicogethes aeneus TaxID=1431903 RepID=A0A9P0AQK0_BRAAE|nr:unnamed protein product [Brassicogethes aeneus]
MDPNSNWKQVQTCMVLCGTWPVELLPEKYRGFYKVAKIFPSLFFFIFMLSLSYGLYLVIIQGDLEDLPPTISLYITYLIISTKTLICQFGGIQRMIKLYVEQDIFLAKTKDEAVLRIRNNYICKAKLCMKAFIFYTPFLSVVFTSTYFFKYYVFWDKNKAKDMVRQQVYHSYLPFDSNEHYLLGLACNAFSSYFIILLYISSSVVLISFLFSISIKLQILQNFLRNLNKYAGNIRKIHKRLSKDQAVFVAVRLCIIEHQNIMKLVLELNSYIKFLLLLEFLANSMQLAANLLAIMDLEFGGIFFCLFVYLFQRFAEIMILHYTADEIKSQSLNLSQAICDSNYYNFNKKSKDCLMLMLLNFLRNLDKYAGNIRKIHKELTEDQAVFVAVRLCIIEHQNIMKFVIELNGYINILLFLEFFTNSLHLAANLLAILEFEISITFIFDVVFLTQKIAEIMVLHYSADEIKSQSLNLSQAICDSTYYNFNKKSKDCLRLMLLSLNLSQAICDSNYYNFNKKSKDCLRLMLLNFLRNLDKYASNIRKIHKELNEDQAIFVAVRLCIIEHQNIMKFVIELNSYINILLFLEFFTNSLHLASNLLAILESLNLSQAICDSTYYNFNKKSKDCLRLMLLFGGIQRMIKLYLEQDIFLAKTKDEAVLRIRNNYICKAKLCMKAFIFYTPFLSVVFTISYFSKYYVFWDKNKAKDMSLNLSQAICDSTYYNFNKKSKDCLRLMLLVSTRTKQSSTSSFYYHWNSRQHTANLVAIMDIEFGGIC